MEIQLTNNQKELKEQFRRFAEEEIAPFAAESDRNEWLSEEIMDKIHRSGYLGSMISEEYGGKDWDPITLGLLNEEIGRVCSSTRAMFTVHGMVAIAIERFGTEEQKKTYLPLMTDGSLLGAFALSEPGAGSDAKSVTCEAEVKNDSFMINGEKKWITMGQAADLFLVVTKLNNNPTVFLVEADTPGLDIVPMSGLMGNRASMLAELHFEDCVIPKENMIGKEGMGLSHVALNSLDYGRYTIAWGCVGLGQACLEKSFTYSGKRKQFGASINKNQLVQKMLTEMIVEVKAARLMCYYAGYLKQMNVAESIMETWNAKYFASKMGVSAADKAVQIHGGNGFIQNYDIERFYRDAKINEVIEGTSQIHEVLIAANANMGWISS
ncbi:acyl-CoA dehydrogenase family protein [Virgibacillus oceani]